MTDEKLRRMQEENLNKNAALLKSAWATDCRSLNEDFSGYVGAPPVYYNCATRQAFSLDVLGNSPTWVHERLNEPSTTDGWRVYSSLPQERIEAITKELKARCGA